MLKGWLNTVNVKGVTEHSQSRVGGGGGGGGGVMGEKCNMVVVAVMVGGADNKQNRYISENYTFMSLVLLWDSISS